jgi:hypothetical protein
MASTLLATVGLGRDVNFQGIDPSRSATRTQPRDDPSDRIIQEIREGAEEVETAERRTEVIREQGVQRLTRIQRTVKANTLREIIPTAQGELSGGGFLVDAFA